MKQNSKELCERIAEKLALTPKAFIEWAEYNKFGFVGLAILGGQVTYGKINTMDVIMSVLNKTKYKIISR